MIKQSDRDKAKKRNRLWDLFGFNYGEGYVGYLRNNHTLNCGCACCRMETFLNRKKNKRERAKAKRECKLQKFSPPSPLPTDEIHESKIDDKRKEVHE